MALSPLTLIQPHKPFTYRGSLIPLLTSHPTTLHKHLTTPYQLTYPKLSLMLALLFIVTCTLLPNYRGRKDNTHYLQLIPLTQEMNRIQRAGTLIQALQNKRLFADTINNLILFAPLGITLNTVLGQARMGRRRRLWLIVGLAFCLSLTIETTQFWYASRASDIDDIITNSLGAILGAIMATHLHLKMVSRTFRPNQR